MGQKIPMKEISFPSKYGLGPDGEEVLKNLGAENLTAYNFTYKNSGITRKLQDKLEDNFVSIKDFGGSEENIDNAENLQNAIDYLVNNSRGGVIYIPEGIYNINERVYLKSNIKIIGAGTNITILINNTDFCAFYYNETNNNGDFLKNFILSNMTIDNDNSKTSGKTHIYLEGATDNVILENLKISRATRRGIFLNKCWTITVRNIEFYRCSGEGKSDLFLFESHNARVLNILSHYENINNQSGISVVNSNGVIISGFDIEDKYYGIKIDACESTLIQGGYMEDNVEYGINLLDTISDENIVNNSTTIQSVYINGRNITKRGISIKNNVNYTIIKGCTFKNIINESIENLNDNVNEPTILEFNKNYNTTYYTDPNDTIKDFENLTF